MTVYIERAMTLARRRWLPLTAALALAALLLARWHPWQQSDPATPRPVALVPTPTLPVAPTPTRPPGRIALPAPTPLAPAATPATPHPATPSGRRGDGTILYVGTLDGQAGIIAASADGTAQRLLVAGQYDSVAWSPSGDRFAAVGPLVSGLTGQLAIFAPDGRPQARYSFDGAVDTQLLWSLDGSKLACSVLSSGPRPPAQPAPTETWQITLWGGVERVTVPVATSVYPFAWTPEGLLTVLSYDGYETRTLWLASADGTAVVRRAEGNFLPLALSPDGEVLYALGSPPRSFATELLAITLRTDVRRVITDADRLGALAAGVPTVSNAYTFLTATVAPDGSHLAIVSERILARGAPGVVPPKPEWTLIFLWPDGTLTGVFRLPEGGWLDSFAWSPDGTKLAFLSTGSTTNNQLFVVDTSGTRRVTARFYLGPYGHPIVSWSPDSQWLAYASLNGLGVVNLIGLPSYVLSPTGGFPAWRP